MFVKPVEGRLVRDPVTKEPLPKSGRYVEDSSFWRRRIAKGDVELVPEPESKARPSAAESRKA
jgi:hypothetical protein